MPPMTGQQIIRGMGHFVQEGVHAFGPVPREHEVQQDDVRPVRFETLQRSRTVAGNRDVEPLFAEQERERVRQRILVLNDQHPGHGTWSSPSRSCSAGPEAPSSSGST